MHHMGRHQSQQAELLFRVLGAGQRWGLVSREEGLTENQDLRGRHTRPQSPGCRRLYGLRQLLAKEATLGNDKNCGQWLPEASQPVRGLTMPYVY